MDDSKTAAPGRERPVCFKTWCKIFLARQKAGCSGDFGPKHNRLEALGVLMGRASARVFGFKVDSFCAA
jgi:hypothetical protein